MVLHSWAAPNAAAEMKAVRSSKMFFNISFVWVGIMVVVMVVLVVMVPRWKSMTQWGRFRLRIVVVIQISRIIVWAYLWIGSVKVKQGKEEKWREKGNIRFL